MAAVVIGTQIAGTVSDATGLGWQSHLIWAANDNSAAGAWWLFNIGSGTTTTVPTYRSTDGVAWVAKTASGAFASIFSGAATHNNFGRNLGCFYKNISSHDVVHLDCGCSGAKFNNEHARVQITGNDATWSSWADNDSSNDNLTITDPVGGTTVLDSTNLPIVVDGQLGGGGNPTAYRGGNTDSGTAWTPGFAAGAMIESVAGDCQAMSLFDVGSGHLVALYSNGAGSGSTAMTNIRRAYYNGTNWTGTAIANVRGSSLGAGVDANNFGACAVTSSDIHVVFRTATGTYEHSRVNATGTVSAGSTISAALNSRMGTGVFLASDGTSVWMFVIGSDANFTVSYLKWNGSVWDAAWTTLESSAQTRGFISGYPVVSNNSIGVIWTQGTSPYDIVFSSLATINAPTVTSPTATALEKTTATLGGTVGSDGGSTVTERGVVYALTATNANPQIGGTGVTKVTAAGTTGLFTVPATGLTAGTRYSYAAYAINSIGTTYSSVGTFTSGAAPVAGPRQYQIGPLYIMDDSTKDFQLAGLYLNETTVTAVVTSGASIFAGGLFRSQLIRGSRS